MDKILRIDTISNLSTDQLVQLYKEGYRISSDYEKDLKFYYDDPNIRNQTYLQPIAPAITKQPQPILEGVFTGIGTVATLALIGGGLLLLFLLTRK